MTEIQVKSILVRVSARFELSGIDCITMPRCVTAVRIIEKSVMGESFVLCPARLDPRLDSR